MPEQALNICLTEVKLFAFKLASLIARETAGDVGRPILIAIARGGLVPCQLVANVLNCDYHILPMARQEFGDVKVGPMTPSIKNGHRAISPNDALPQDRQIWFIDDLIDTGATFRKLLAMGWFNSSLTLVRMGVLIKKQGCLKGNHNEIAEAERVVFAPASNSEKKWIHFPWEVS